MTSDPMHELDSIKVERLRALLPATGAGIYLDTASFGPLPAETAAAMREADEWELRVGRATDGRTENLEQRVEEARAVLAALLVADPDEVVLAAGIEAAVGIAQRISGRPDPVLLDASLMVGAVPLEASVLEVDFVCLACDKWLLGPEQTAALWISPRMGPLGVGVPPSTGLGRTAVLGLARSVGWLEMYVGLDWIFGRTAALVARFRELVSAIPGVTVSPSAREQPAVLCFAVQGWSSIEVADELRRRAFAIIGLSPDGELVRASVGWFNIESEIDTFVGALGEIAANTPDSLPRRLPLLGQ